MSNLFARQFSTQGQILSVGQRCTRFARRFSRPIQSSHSLSSLAARSLSSYSTRSLSSLATRSLSSYSTHSLSSYSTHSHSSYSTQYSPLAEEFSSNEINISHSRGGCRQITLSRPAALHALNHSMVKQLLPIYRAYNSDPSTSTVILKGAPIEKNGKQKYAFCAGGDIVSILKDRDLSFFKDEYDLDYLIGTLAKPHVAIWNGIVMGGGVGISVHGSTMRVATENSLFAMPETQIGFFTDVGGSYFLPRLKNQSLGYYLALTGERLKGNQLVAAGLATHYIPNEKLSQMEQLLLRLDSNNPMEVRSTLAHLCEHKKHDSNIPHIEDITRVFDPSKHSSVESILDALKQDGTEWANKTHQRLMSLSPTSLKVVFKLLKLGSKLEFKECFEMELGVAERMLQEGSDFFEGVRALLVDKDQKPKWNPKSIEEVRDELVDEFFTKVPKHDE